MRGTTQRRVLAAFALAFAGILVCGLASYLNTRQLLDTGRTVVHTREVIGEIEGSTTAMADTEAAARAYVITGDASASELYHLSATRLKARLQAIRGLTADNPRQQRRLNDLEPLVAQRLATLDSLVSTRRAGSMDQNQATLLVHRGLEQMGRIRLILMEMESEEYRLLAIRVRTRETESWHTMILWALGTLLSLVVLAVVFHLLQKEIVQREQAEKKLQAAHDDLELRVRQRTDELARLNQELQNEVHSHERTEKTLEEEREFLQAVLFNLGDGIMACNPEGTVTLSNPAVRALRGLPEGHVPRDAWDHAGNLFQPDGKTPLSADQVPLRRALQGEHFRDQELVVAFPGQPSRIILANGQPISDREGHKLGAVIAVHDVTEGRELREQLAQAQKMEAIGQLAGGIAHDFNNLLTIISGYGNLLAEAVDPEKGLQHNYVREIQNAADRAATLTRQLLAFSRKQILNPQVVDLNEVMAGIHKMLQRLIGENISLSTLQQPGLGHVRMDPSQIEQVILNLAINSRDSMPEGGRLTIETANVELDENYTRSHAGVVPGQYVMLAVSDTGCGMDSATLKRIFEPFFTTKEKGRGTGLGLATVYGIIKQSGSHIWVYSEPNRGTVFKIYMPRVAADAGEAPVEVAAQRRPSRGTESILIVEDEESLRELITRVLAGHGYSVLGAESGEAAMALSREHAGEIHLIVTDVIMPGMSGRDVAEQLNRMRPSARVLFISGYTDGAIVHHGVLESGTAFLQKPFTPDALLRKVREVLDAVPQA